MFKSKVILPQEVKNGDNESVYFYRNEQQSFWLFCNPQQSFDTSLGYILEAIDHSSNSTKALRENFTSRHFFFGKIHS